MARHAGDRPRRQIRRLDRGAHPRLVRRPGAGDRRYAIVGGASKHVGAFQGGQIRIMHRTVTLTGKPRFTEAFAATSDAGVFDSRGVTYTGEAAGRRFVGSGIFRTSPHDLRLFPGDADGVLQPGGRYDGIAEPGARSAQL